MKKRYLITLGLAIVFTLSACGSNSDDMSSSNTNPAENSDTGSELVKFPENYKDGVLYTTVTRGDVNEKLYTSRETIEAVKNGLPIPSGAVITLEIYRGGDLSRIFVSEKRTDWEDEAPPEMQNGDWRYQSFTADKSVDYEENTARCISCHATEERDDFMYTLDEMESYELEDFTGAVGQSSDNHIQIEDWKVATLANYLTTIN